VAKIKRYAILTPFARADVVAAIAALHRLDVYVLATKSGALIVREMPVEQYDEWDIRNITGPDESDETPKEPSDDGHAVAEVFSKLSKYGVVLMIVDLSDTEGFEEGVSGLVRARRYMAGKSGEDIPAGLLLNAVDPVIERVILGEVKPQDQGAISAIALEANDVADLLNLSGANGDSKSGGAGESHKKRRFFGRNKGNE
jgi:hypothetical protein